MRLQMENIQESGWRRIPGTIKKRSWIILIVVLALILLFAINAQAMTSPNYQLAWIVLGGGGGPASSANYAVNYTVGQTAIGNITSQNYRTGLGFWAEVWTNLLYLPLISR